MANEPTLRQFAEEIARAFHEYGQTHGWAADSYRLFLHYNEDWSTAHVILVTDNIKEANGRNQWKDLMGFLDQQLHNFLQYVNTFNVTIRNSAQIKEGGIYEFGPEFIPIDEILAHKPVA